MSESVHDKVQVSYLSQHALYLFLPLFSFLLVCLFVYFWRREHTTHDQQNKSATPRVTGMEFLFKSYINAK